MTYRALILFILDPKKYMHTQWIGGYCKYSSMPLRIPELQSCNKIPYLQYDLRYSRLYLKPWSRQT